MGKKPLPSREALVGDTVDSIASRFDLRYREQKWLDATVQLIVDDGQALEQFLSGDMSFFRKSQFQQLGGLDALVAFEQRDAVFDALRQSLIVRQSSLLINPKETRNGHASTCERETRDRERPFDGLRATARLATSSAAGCGRRWTS
ncbi:MAG: hypothetical protein IPK99_13770 [Flavobacteriales bacterium]|nr:hypothetical protein [Flavobacteriales bacterium]